MNLRPIVFVGAVMVGVGLSLFVEACGADDGTQPIDARSDAQAGHLDASRADAERDSDGALPHPVDGGVACECSGAVELGAPVNLRGGDTPVLTRSEYDYAPTVMHDGAVFRTWWCGGVAGDHILHAEADSPTGPWHAHANTAPGTFDDVFGPTGNGADFDGLHTCDPSVVVVDGTYYLYYGGLDVQTASPSMTSGVTRIGVAKSSDGLSFTRLNSGKPIITVARSPSSLPNKYGAGQPSVTYVDGKFWMIYTDTTGLASNAVNGGGQYVLRSSDPTFQSGVEELTSSGFASAPTHTGYSLIEAFSVDWAFVDRAGGFVVATTGVPGEVHLRLYPKSLAGAPMFQKLTGSWTEGVGLVANRDRHIASPDCSTTIRVDLLRSVGTAGAPATWDLAHLGADLPSGLSCVAR